MTAPNHALTGAAIGLTVANPPLAMILAVLSHFVCDAIPHYDPLVGTKEEIMGSSKFFREQIVAGAIVCFLIVLTLALTRPQHWLLIAFCAFLAASPDLFFITRFIEVKRTGKDPLDRNWFWRFHHWIQWKQQPDLLWVEAVWFIIFGTFLAVHL